MSARYNALLDAEVAQSEAALRTREQLLYYIGRLPLDGCPPILREAFASEVSPPLRRSAALGAILHGELAIEDRYMELLEDPAEGLMNRSIQMVYFGDVYADLHTFTESGENWSKTRAAIYRRLRGNSIRDIRLRRWDLRTLHSFYETREFQPVLSSEEVDILASISLEDPASAARTIRLQRQHALLLARLRIER
jgi:hypothetical protein